MSKAANPKGVRGDLAGRPATQWQGSQPVNPNSSEAVARTAAVLLAVVNPVAALVTVLLVAGGRSLTKSVRRWICWGGWASVVVGVLLGTFRRYLQPYREIWAEVWADPGHAELAKLASENWPGWIVDQLPFAVTVAAGIGGVWLLRRARFQADWRTVQEPVSEKKLDSVLQELAQNDRRKPARTLDDLRIRLGVDKLTGEPAEISGRALQRHGFIPGASGYGKSRTIEQLVYELCVSPHARPLDIAFLFADMKADPQLIDAMHGGAHHAGRRFKLVTITGAGTTYNPIRHGTAEQIRSRIVECLDQVAGGGFSEPHHREAAEEFLLFVVRALDDLVAGQVQEVFPDGTRRAWRRDLPDLARLMTLKALGSRTDKLSARVQRDVTDYLTYLDTEAKDLKRSIPGLATRVRNLVSGDAGRVLVEAEGGIDLYESVHRGDIVLFSLAANTDAKAARQIGNLFLTDLGAVGDRLLAENYGENGGLFIAGVDEFSGLGGSTMGGLFQRLRAAGGGLLICTQDLADLSDVSDAFLNAVLTNANVLLLHRTKASAEQVSQLLGTYEGWEETLQVQDDIGILGATTSGSGAGSLRQVDRFKVHPNELRELRVGEAIVAVGHPEDTSRTVRMSLAPRYPVPEAEDSRAVKSLGSERPAAPVELVKPSDPASQGHPIPAPRLVMEPKVVESSTPAAVVQHTAPQQRNASAAEAHHGNHPGPERQPNPQRDTGQADNDSEPVESPEADTKADGGEPSATPNTAAPENSAPQRAIDVWGA
ncbi:type IV secretory system conjugative DNA transfer family protein [Streptomyces erythrochromogenes]|uniref:type IV secretory system conjugative DNA transfer family protein n=1 Tax=Streptomyces erythrochromogenes TaxID=285574 RepID=UPI0036881D17